MERQTLHDAATNAAGGHPTSHSYSAWRNSQVTQPRIFHYTPPNQQQSAQPQQIQQQQPGLSTQSGTAAAGNNLTNIDKNIIFANSDRLNQQFQLQNAGAQGQSTFPGLQEDPNNPAQNTTDPNLGASSDDGNPASDKQNTQAQTATGGRVLASSKRAAQNRAAQRAFRQRKDRYIKSLEQKATEFDLSHSIIADLRKENIYLRDYVVRLQNEVDSLNTELGRAPMFNSNPTQRNPQNQSNPSQLPVSLGQNYPMQIDPQTAAAAVAANVQHDNQSGLTRLAPAESHNAISMPATDQQMGETKAEEQVAPAKKQARSRKRKNEQQSEAQ
jgi:bZIP transcription factor